MRKFNNWLVTKIADILGSPYFFYFCVILDVAELPAVIKAGSTIAYVSYISQTVIQLLALPILQAYQNIQNDHHEDTMAHLKAIHKHLGIESSVQAPLKQKRAAQKLPPKTPIL